MAAALGDLLQATVRGTYLGQTCLNVYHFRVTSITGLAGNYLELFADFIENPITVSIAAVQISSYNYEDIEARNLSNGLDFFAKPLTLTGGITDSGANGVPSFVSMGWQLVRESLATRNGYKRYAGLSDTLLVDNLYAISALEEAQIRSVLALDWVEGVVTVGEPIIWGSPRSAAPVGSYVYSSIGDAIYKNVGTQNTRKPGRGI